MAPPDDPERKGLSYTQFEVLESQGKHYTGNNREQWVDSKSLCTTCKWAHIVRRSSSNTRSIFCGSLTRWVPEDIGECSEFHTFTQMTLQQMGAIATVIELNEKKVGFHG